MSTTALVLLAIACTTAVIGFVIWLGGEDVCETDDEQID